MEPRAAEGVRCLSRHAGVSWQAKAEKDGLEASPDHGAARRVAIFSPPPWHGHVAVAAQLDRRDEVDGARLARSRDAQWQRTIQPAAPGRGGSACCRRHHNDLGKTRLVWARASCCRGARRLAPLQLEFGVPHVRGDKSVETN